MGYKILLSILLVIALSTAFANFTSRSVAALKAKIHAKSTQNRIMNTADPYSYCFTSSNTTIWVVPTQTLTAYLYDNAVSVPVVDQTVWVIDKYDRGYFAGNAYTALDVVDLSQRYLIGSVTSEGKVYITFYYSTASSFDLVTGIGTLNAKSSGQCSFTMQMNSGTDGVDGLVHWSYMVPVKPGDAYYENLPGSGGLTVPQFIDQFI